MLEYIKQNRISLL